MKRMRSRRSFYKNITAAMTFVRHQRSLFVLLCLVVVGIVSGIWVFRLLNNEHRTFIGEVFYNPVLLTDWTNSIASVVGACLRHSLCIVLLFLFGLTAFGCPLILCMVLVFGFRVGVILSMSYITYGFWYTAVTLYLPFLLVGIATMIGVRRSLRMSCVFSSQLLPFGAHCGGLWSEFKHYLLSYTISFGCIVAASITEVLLQLLQSMM